MEEETKKEPEKPEEKGWAEKAKKLIDKADDFIDENVDKVKKSKAFGKVKETVDKAEDYVEDKVNEVKSGEAKEKLKAFAEKAEVEAKEKLSKAKEFGKKVAAKTADKLDDLAENIRNKSKDDIKPEDPKDNPQT
jgi:ElaB/YqjD/DUF883 family membrane-anchored ribosome-binding protein